MDKKKNQINVIHPYRTTYGTWVYDDPDIPVYAEAFVAGSSELIDMVVGKEYNTFTAYLSAKPMPDVTVILDNIDKEKEESYKGSQFEGFEMKGFYRMRGTGHENWFCGHLLDYFEGYPETIYVQIKK